MAKGARASTIKTNNAALKSKVFGPVENARTERLSAKLLELASQPKPKPVEQDVVMDSEEGNAGNDVVPVAEPKQTDEMEMDQDSLKAKSSSKPSNGRIEKRRNSRKAGIVFPKFKNGKRTGKSKAKK